MTLPASAVEQDVAASLGVSLSQLRFTLCLFSCIPVGFCQKLITNTTGGHLFALFSGLLLIYLPFGSGVMHLLLPALFTFVAMHLFPKRCGSLVWLVCFPHLIYLHFTNASGAAWQDGAMDATGALMILFLKLVAVAQCRQDAETLSSESASSYQKEKMIHSTPSALEFFGYTLGFGHLLSGPFSEFKDYKHYIERKGLWSQELPSRTFPLLRSFGAAVLFLVLCVTLGPTFDYTVLFTDKYRHAPLAAKYCIVYGICIFYRFKFYFAWGVAEASSVASGFGYNGVSTKDGEAEKEKWDRCRNVNVWETEFATSFAKIPAHWNICTGLFLRRYVYDRLTPEKGKPTFFTLLATQIVSALWHGLYPGYYLFFATSAVAISVSKTVHRWEQNNSLAKMPIYELMKMLFVAMTLNYTAIAFVILSFKQSIEVYASLKFIPHFVCLVLFCLGRAQPNPKTVKAD